MMYRTQAERDEETIVEEKEPKKPFEMPAFGYAFAMAAMFIVMGLGCTYFDRNSEPHNVAGMAVAWAMACLTLIFSLALAAIKKFA